jgi:hypothetical protein
MASQPIPRSATALPGRDERLGVGGAISGLPNRKEV